MVNDFDLKKASKGDEKSIKTVLLEISPFVLSLCRKWCRPPIEAEDVAQDSLIAIVKNLKSFKGDSAFNTWVYSVSYRTFLDAFRKQSRRDKIVEFSSITETSTSDFLKETTTEIDESSVVIEALGEMDPLSSQVLFMFTIDGLSYEEIASELDIPVGTVRSRLARARIKFRELLLKNGTYTKADNVKNTRQEK